MLILPNQNWTTAPVPVAPVAPYIDTVTPRDTLNASAVSAAETQLGVAAENAPLRVIYGQVRLGPQIAYVLAYQNALVILAIWGHGPIDSIVSLDIDDLPVKPGVQAVHYTGAPGQVVDPTLVAAFAGQTPAVSYTDALAAIAYSVVTVPAAASQGFPRINAVVRGIKVSIPGSPAQWSDNPAYCLADFITNSVYGMMRTVDWTSVTAVAADCNVLAGGVEKLRTLNLALEVVQPVQNWLDTLRTYAGCWVVPSGVDFKFISDKVPVAGVVASYIHDSGTIQAIGGVKKRGVQSMPTVMTITYTDTGATPYRNSTVTVYAAGVLAGTTPRRESAVTLPGVTRYSQAYREAVERLNKLLLNDLSMSLNVFDAALAREVGDVVAVTHPLGFAAKQMRVMSVSGDYGRFTLGLVEYDPAVYDASVATGPTWVDTNLPNPTSPPAITAVAMVEEVFQLENGTWASRWRVTWAAAPYSFLANYRAELWAGASLIHSNSVLNNVWPTPAVQEGVVYTAKIAAVSSIGSVGAWGTQSGTALGKQLIPGNVPSVSAFEAGGRVYITWLPAIDIDIWRYEVRYGAVGGAWATATLIDRVDALRLQSDQVPTGVWTLYVKAIDSVQQYSAAAASVGVTVTSDANSFLVSTKFQSAPALTNMAAFWRGRTDPNTYFVTEDGAMAGAKFPAGASTYASIAAAYHAAITSTWLGEVEDFGLLLGGNWTGVATVQDLNPGAGGHLSYLGWSLDGSAWTYPAGLSQKLNARFARMKHESLAAATMLVTIPTQSIRIDAIPRQEDFLSNSLSTGGKAIVLAQQYIAAQSITVTPSGTAALIGVVDDVELVGRLSPTDKSPYLTVVGNTVTNTRAGSWDTARAAVPLPPGKWYWEGVAIGASMVGVANSTATLVNLYPGTDANGWSYYSGNGNLYHNGSAVAFGATYTAGDVIGLAYDSVAQTLACYKNNVYQASATGVAGDVYPAVALADSGTMTLKFQASTFTYGVPAGFAQIPGQYMVYLFNTAGGKVANEFRTTFKGV